MKRGGKKARSSGKKKVVAAAGFECALPDCHDKDAKGRCTACKRTSYCNAACQTLDWRRHKDDCKRWKLELLQAAALMTASEPGASDQMLTEA